MPNEILEAIELTAGAIRKNIESDWIIGFSGGKDSTSTLKVFLSALRQVDENPKSVKLVYCDTGVENPVIDRYVKSTLNDVSEEFASKGLDIDVKILTAPVTDRYFVKVIGRGYPTPTNSFRWCTKGLRINPVARFVATTQGDPVVVIGTRRNESEQRRRTVERYGNDHWQKQAEGSNAHRLFCPILNLSVSDVWDSIFMLGDPVSINAKLLEEIYTDASGECPIIKSPTAPPCASGRFGCWTCTVVRKDRSALKMISAGHTILKPYLHLRDWLSEFRNNPLNRWPVRRNGKRLPGPFHTRARLEILLKVIDLENEVGQSIISIDERVEIARLWALDQSIEDYLELKPVSDLKGARSCRGVDRAPPVPTVAA